MTDNPEVSAVTWGGQRLAYTIRRSPRRKKTVAVTFDLSGGVVVMAPEHLAAERLDAIVTRKAAWIARRLLDSEGYFPAPSPREYISGESVLYLGRHYRLKVDPSASGDTKLRGAVATRARVGGAGPGCSRASRNDLVVPPPCG